MSDTQLHVSVVQYNPVFNDKASNIKNIHDIVTGLEQTDLVVFPEGSLQGYVFESFDSAYEASVPNDGEEILALHELAQARNIALVVGYLERNADGGYYNSSIALLPDGTRQNYRKTHFPQIGADRWATKGDTLDSLFEYKNFNIGMLICFDLRFPESARALSRAGADIVLLPTNWLQGHHASPNFVVLARAWENRIYMAAANRVGTENGTRFLGQSQIVDPHGDLLAKAPEEGVSVITATVDRDLVRDKTILAPDGSRYNFWDAYDPTLYQR